MFEKFLNHIGTNWSVFMTAKAAFLTLTALGLAAGFGLGTMYYNSQIASLHEHINTKDAQLKAKDSELSTKDDQLRRYQVVLGIKSGSAGALVELNNQELALKAQSIVAQLRRHTTSLERQTAAVNEQLAAKKLNKDQASKANLAAIREVSQDFDNNLASDTYNVENELRSRLDPSALSHLIMVPGFVYDHNPRTRITFPNLMRGSGFDAMYLGKLADEIEQMAHLLPPDHPKL
jgi:hypothetical protein